MLTGYFDANATSPLHPAAREAWLQASDNAWANPSSLHRPGAAARHFLEDCRARAASLLHCDPGNILFTSGATESNNTVIHLAATREWTLAISPLEHPSLMAPAAHRLPGRTHLLQVQEDGTLCLESLRTILQKHRPKLVSLMAANNETGVIQPWEKALALCREHGALFHCDAVQWAGRMSSSALGQCDFVSLSGHKFGGPRGTGLLLSTVNWSSSAALLSGGGQEMQLRSGTENLPGIAGMIAAWEAAEALCSGPANTLAEAARTDFESLLLDAVPGIEIIARHSPRLWNTVMVVMPEQKNVKWLTRLSHAGFAISTGSACSSGGGASEVLTAMGLPAEALTRVLRISALRTTTPADWTALANAFRHTAATIHDRPVR